MNDKDLKKLTRTDLLEMLIEQSQEVESLKIRLAEAEAHLQQREIAVQNAGSIAEAALHLNGVFEAAEEACKQYQENIRNLSAQQETICSRLEEESMKRAEQRLAAAMKKCEKLESDTKVRCAEMITNTRAECRAYWDEVSRRLEDFYSEHKGLRELLSIVTEENE